MPPFPVNIPTLPLRPPPLLEPTLAGPTLLRPISLEPRALILPPIRMLFSRRSCLTAPFARLTVIPANPQVIFASVVLSLGWLPATHDCQAKATLNFTQIGISFSAPAVNGSWGVTGENLPLDAPRPPYSRHRRFTLPFPNPVGRPTMESVDGNRIHGLGNTPTLPADGSTTMLLVGSTSNKNPSILYGFGRKNSIGYGPIIPFSPISTKTNRKVGCPSNPPVPSRHWFSISKTLYGLNLAALSLPLRFP